MKINNGYVVSQDDGKRAGPAYSLHRAWVELTRDAAKTQVPPTMPLDLSAMAGRQFAVAWLGHASFLLRVGERWMLVDPVFAQTVGPSAGLGPKRLASLPLRPADLPRIDFVLISHDHYDYLDIDEIRMLVMQEGGPPRFLVGEGLAPWFADNCGVVAEEFAWWQSLRANDIEMTFVAAQHSSGRTPWAKDSTRWGGWVITYRDARFYFAGDTSYVADLFKDIHDRIGHIDLAALPIGAYLPRDLMQFEHMDPSEAVQAHEYLAPSQSFGIHWGTFQLGDEQPLQAATDLVSAIGERNVHNFGLAPIGAVIDVRKAADVPADQLGQPLSHALSATIVESTPKR